MHPSTLFDLSGKTALVTGGATGIGRMAAEGLMAAGCDVMLVSRKGGACQAAADALNALKPTGNPTGNSNGNRTGRASGFAGDVATEDGVAKLVEEVKNRTGKLHILMNNAGRSWGENLDEFPYQAWDKIMSVNLSGLFHLTRMLLPQLEQAAHAGDPARIINVGSVMGEVPMGDGAYSYAASKAAVHHISKILAKELAPRSITVNALAPGPFVSNMTAFVTADAKTRSIVAESVPLKRVGRGEDIAGAVQFLCSRAGSYITGAILPLSGGINVATGPALFEQAQSKARKGSV